MKCLGLELLEQENLPEAKREETCDPSPISKMQMPEPARRPEVETGASGECDVNVQ